MSFSIACCVQRRHRRCRVSQEVWKFAVCLLAPFGASVIYANPDVMKELILRLNLVAVPAAGPAPPSPAEIERLVAQQRTTRKEKK